MRSTRKPKVQKIPLTGLPTHQKLTLWADLLEAVPEHKLKMNCWVQRNDEAVLRTTPEEVIDHCGTAACAWGWAGVFFKELHFVSFYCAPQLKSPPADSLWYPETAAAAYLFGCKQEEIDGIIWNLDATKAQTITAIRDLAAQYRTQGAES